MWVHTDDGLSPVSPTSSTLPGSPLSPTSPISPPFSHFPHFRHFAPSTAFVYSASVAYLPTFRRLASFQRGHGKDQVPCIAVEGVHML